ncbi:MAG: serine/threonine-protein kinase, partial [Polyangiaceae bacterium]
MTHALDAPSAHDEISLVSVAFELPPPPLPAMDPTLPSRRDPGSGVRPRSPSSAPTRPPLEAGRLLAWRYRLERKVGAGGMGEVWAAEHVGLQIDVAVKVLLPRALRSPEIVARFEREAILLGRLHLERCRHVPRVIDFFADEACGPTLVTELVNGTSLAEVVKMPVSVEDAVAMGIQLATALADLHRAGVVHRDFKPSNVILGRAAGGCRRVIILDLGVSRLVREEPGRPELADITTGDVVVGTIEYMAPEQILRCGDATACADLYALGALLYRAVAGRHAFGPDLDKLDMIRAKLTV